MAITLDGTAGTTTPALTNSALTSGRVTYAGTSGVLQDSANLLFNGNNLGLGTTLSAWGTTGTVIRALQIGAAGSFAAGAVDASTHVSQNAYFDGTDWRYIQSAGATNYYLTQTTHNWRIASAGTAGNPITFTTVMTLDASGNLLVGTTSSGAGIGYSTKIAVDGGSGEPSIFKTSAGVSATCIRAWNSATTGNNSFEVFQTEAGGTERGNINYNRAGGLVAYNTTSDYRAKDIYGPVTNSGEVIDSVPVYMGKMKEATQERPMFIAHETPAYAHTGEKDAVDADGNPIYQQMDASALVPILWAEVKSLRARIAALEAK